MDCFVHKWLFRTRHWESFRTLNMRNQDQLVKMIFNHICATFFCLVLFTQVKQLRSQSFQDHDVQVIGKFGGNVDLIWNFFNGGYSFVRIRFTKQPDTVIMSVLPGRPPSPGAGFEETVEYIEPYGINISNLTLSDSALYTCEINLNNTEKYTNETVLTVFKYLEPLEVLMSVVRENGELNTGDDVASGESLTVTVHAPENEPAAVDIRIQILYDGLIDQTEKCENRSVASPCIFDYEVLDGKVGQNLTIEACLTHPAISSTSCSNITLSIKDLNTLTSSVALDDTSVSTYTLPPTEDPSVTQPSSSPTVSASDDPTPDPQPGWSHWYILLIVLGSLVILVVIAVVIHRRTQRKNDDLNLVTELKSSPVPPAPADHVRVNTTGYRPSQHQQPRREDNTAYYVQGTSGARL